VGKTIGVQLCSDKDGRTGGDRISRRFVFGKRVWEWQGEMMGAHKIEGVLFGTPGAGQWRDE
jgi:hypothetical protein